MDRALRPIANVRGGDGEAALATGRVATVTDAKSLRQPRLSDCRRPVRRGEDQGRWIATGRPQRRLATRGIRVPYNRLRFVMDEGPPVPPVPARWPGGPCDGCEDPVSGFRKPRRSPVFLPVCRDRGMSGLRPWAALTGEVRYRIDAFVGRCPGPEGVADRSTPLNWIQGPG